MIALSKVSKSFGSHLVLDEISFSLSPGEIVGFIGANGSGKTTTMRVIMGLLSLDSGTVTIDGQLPRINRKVSQSLGYLPEERGLYMNEPLLSQLHFFGELQRMSKRSRDEQINQLLYQLEIERYRNSRLRELSLGNQQRAQIAVALLHDPRYLILDEPFSGLDPMGIESLLNILRAESERGVAILFSSHILAQVEEISNRVLVLSGGHIHSREDLSGELIDFYREVEASNVR
jgi:ABC-2 type transport system ATP-binding protein